MAKERQSKVVVGKIHISHWAKDKLEDRLRLLLSTKKKYEQKGGRKADNFYWTFSNFIEMNPSSAEKAFFARLVKIKKQTSETVFDPDLPIFRHIP